MINDYVVSIGLEVHCELKTQSKLLCRCPNEFGGEPNTRCCPVCTGMPGAMPALNRKAVEYTMRAGLALGCEVSEYCRWDRKNYFYPDLPKAWQITQYDLPIVRNGMLEYDFHGECKRVHISRIHLEEDAGKLIHKDGVTYVDYNRCGVPLMEIVTEPDLHTPEEAVAFLSELRNVIKYTGVSDVKMQEGSLRCDVNISVAKIGEPLGIRTETKNVNSFKAVGRLCKFEAERQISVLEQGGTIEYQTRRWDDIKNIGYCIRGKENKHDYRYFPEPDLPPILLTKEYVDQIRKSVPISMRQKIQLYIDNYGLSLYDAKILTADKDISDLFDQTVNLGANPKKAANLIMGEVLKLSKSVGNEDLDIGVSANQLYEILRLVDEGTVSITSVKNQLLPAVWKTDFEPEKIVDELGIRMCNDRNVIECELRELLKIHNEAVTEYRNGNYKVFSFLLGRAMKQTKGKCDAVLVNETLNKLLNNKENEK